MNRKLVVYVVLILGLIAGCGKVDTPTSMLQTASSIVADTLSAPLANPFPLLPDPPNAVEGKITDLTLEEFQNILAKVPEPFTPIKEKMSGPDKIGGLNSAAIALNSRICYYAEGQIGVYSGLQCKPWASWLVHYVCGKWLPSTASTSGCASCGWYWNYSPSVCVGFRGPIELIVPGQLIQMWLGTNNPHTAICVALTATGMYWIDSNYVASLRVGVHYVSFSTFYAMTNWYFTVYQIVP